MVFRAPPRALRTWERWYPPDLDRPGRLPHQQGLSEARLGYPNWGARDPGQCMQAGIKTVMVVR